MLLYQQIHATVFFHKQRHNCDFGQENVSQHLTKCRYRGRVPTRIMAAGGQRRRSVKLPFENWSLISTDKCPILSAYDKDFNNC